MKSSTLYRWLEWTFQPQTCTEVFPVIGLQEDNTEEITRVYTATFASPEVLSSWNGWTPTPACSLRITRSRSG